MEKRFFITVPLAIAVMLLSLYGVEHYFADIDGQLKEMIYIVVFLCIVAVFASVWLQFFLSDLQKAYNDQEEEIEYLDEEKQIFVEFLKNHNLKGYFLKYLKKKDAKEDEKNDEDDTYTPMYGYLLKDLEEKGQE